MITMHGFFDLKENHSENEFKKAYDAFAINLQKEQLIVAARIMRHRPDKNYDSTPPAQKYYISMDFVDFEQTQACWDFIERNEPPDNLLHRLVYGMITEYSFYLTEDFGSNADG